MVPDPEELHEGCNVHHQPTLSDINQIINQVGAHIGKNSPHQRSGVTYFLISNIKIQVT